jgi:hypothetical protein
LKRAKALFDRDRIAAEDDNRKTDWSGLKGGGIKVIAFSAHFSTCVGLPLGLDGQGAGEEPER